MSQVNKKSKNNLKVLFVYPGTPLPKSRLKTFNTWEKSGYNLKVLFAYKESYKSSCFDRVLHKLKIPRDMHNLNGRIKTAVKKFRPDLVFIVKGVIVRPNTIKYLKKIGIKTVSWSNDDMYAWHNRSLWYSWSLQHYDLVVTQKSYNCNLNELPSLGAKVLFQDKAIDPDINYPVKNCNAFNVVHDVIFIGTKEQDRLEHLLYLAEHGVVIHIYGWSVPEDNLHSNLIFHNTHLYGADYNAALGCSKISLNFLRKMNRDLQTSRSIEIPAAGGFMLTERTFEHQRLFQEGEEAEFFGSKEELLKKINYYIKNDKKRIEIANSGYLRCLKSKYTFTNRIQEIVNTLYEGK